MADEEFSETHSSIRRYMTTRERLNKTRWRAALIVVTGFLIALGAIIAQDRYREFAMALGFVAFAIFGGAMIYAIWTGRCVHCGQRIGIFLDGEEGEKFHRKMRFCPYCGKSLDDDAAT